MLTAASACLCACGCLLARRYRAWEPQALAVSAHTGKGVPALARLVSQFQQALTDSGELHRWAGALCWQHTTSAIHAHTWHDTAVCREEGVRGVCVCVRGRPLQHVARHAESASCACHKLRSQAAAGT